MTAANYAVFLQPAHTAQTGRCCQSDALRQLDIGDTPFRLKFAQQALVDIVQIRHVFKGSPMNGLRHMHCVGAADCLTR